MAVGSSDAASANVVQVDFLSHWRVLDRGHGPSSFLKSCKAMLAFFRTSAESSDQAGWLERLQASAVQIACIVFFSACSTQGAAQAFCILSTSILHPKLHAHAVYGSRVREWKQLADFRCAQGL